MTNTHNGPCILCGASVSDSESYVTAREGYAHRQCITSTETAEA